MFCPSCGARLAEGLSFCKHCGAGLEALDRTSDSREKSEKSIETLVFVIAGTTITLLGMALGALVLMSEGKIDAGFGRIFVISNLVGFFLVEATLFWHLRRQIRGTPAVSAARDLSTRELTEGAAAPQLRQAPEPPDISAETTRKLETVYRKD